MYTVHKKDIQFSISYEKSNFDINRIINKKATGTTATTKINYPVHFACISELNGRDILFLFFLVLFIKY